MASFFWDRHALAAWRSGELPTVAGEWRCAVGELSGRAPRLPGPLQRLGFDMHCTLAHIHRVAERREGGWSFTGQGVFAEAVACRPAVLALSACNMVSAGPEGAKEEA